MRVGVTVKPVLKGYFYMETSAFLDTFQALLFVFMYFTAKLVQSGQGKVRERNFLVRFHCVVSKCKTGYI